MGYLTTDDNVLCSVLDLDGAVAVPHGKIACMQHATGIELPRSLRVLIIVIGTNIPHKYNLTNLSPIPLHINSLISSHIQADVHQ